MPAIYRIKNQQNGKSYIGASGNPRARWRHHRSLLNREKHTPEFVMDWQEFGEAAFTFEIMELVELENLAERETQWILREDSVKNGYNLIHGSSGNSGASLSVQTRQLMSSVRKGRAKSEEWKQKIREGLKKWREENEQRKITESLSIGN